MNLTWYNEGNKSNILSIVFKKNITDSHFMIQNISLVVTPSDEMFPGIKGNLKLSLTEVLWSIMFSMNDYDNDNWFIFWYGSDVVPVC